MAYNRRNLLEKIVEIQEIVLREQKRGATQRWIYQNLIKKRYFISITTFNAYLAYNAKKELAELDRRQAEMEKNKQLKMNI